MVAVSRPVADIPVKPQKTPMGNYEWNGAPPTVAQRVIAGVYVIILLGFVSRASAYARQRARHVLPPTARLVRPELTDWTLAPVVPSALLSVGFAGIELGSIYRLHNSLIVSGIRGRGDGFRGGHTFETAPQHADRCGRRGA